MRNAITHQQTDCQTGAIQSASESKVQEAHVFPKMKQTKRKFPVGNEIRHVPCSQNL